ncbi:MAG: hypothetical protein BWZ10_03213 [candidate division BRC1 bacterium ADurb.BinA364]|nr:MAG: hypothetical protein BWZ10_03213 [candidate division BRC1 bacterium ADurb.BinA364]
MIQAGVGHVDGFGSAAEQKSNPLARLQGPMAHAQDAQRGGFGQNRRQIGHRIGIVEHERIRRKALDFLNHADEHRRIAPGANPSARSGGIADDLKAAVFARDFAIEQARFVPPGVDGQHDKIRPGEGLVLIAAGAVPDSGAVFFRQHFAIGAKLPRRREVDVEKRDLRSFERLRAIEIRDQFGHPAIAAASDKYGFDRAHSSFSSAGRIRAELHGDSRILRRRCDLGFCRRGERH